MNENKNLSEKELAKKVKETTFSYKLIWVSYAIIALHIFILPHDILDRAPFLVPYTEFMKNNLPFIYQISLRISNIPQTGILYASNMTIISILFFPFMAYFGYLYSKHNLMTKLGYADNKCDFSYLYKVLKIEDLIKIFLLVLATLLLVVYLLYSMNDGGLFDTNPRGKPSSENINSEFGLFLRISILLFAMITFASLFIMSAFVFIKDLIKRLKNLF